MEETDYRNAASYELSLVDNEHLSAKVVASEKQGSLGEPILLENVKWFCNVRWAIAGLFAVFGLLCLFPEMLQSVGLRAHASWPFITSLVLILANAGFLMHARHLEGLNICIRAKKNLWVQILVDLLVVTVVVHYVGSIETSAPFLYLFHVILACIFFSSRESLGVVLVALVLYASCIIFEKAGLVSPAGVYADIGPRGHIENSSAFFLIMISNVGIWFVVWYLTSRLSAMVRAREEELVETNVRLLETQKEKTHHMLRTTHELKSPFSAIHANAQLLSKGHCGTLSDEAIDVVRRISARCRRLTRVIQEMLQLANLSFEKMEAFDWDEIDLGGILEWVREQCQNQVAKERQIVIEGNIEHVSAIGVEDHLKMLFDNLVSNAVLYSHKGGRVKLLCNASAANGPVVVIEDHGIGIPEEKLPHIFDEYYHTDEAVKHNKASTGLGLAIVKRIVGTHGIHLTVQSKQDVGTRVELRFGKTKVNQAESFGREANNGVCDDS